LAPTQVLDLDAIAASLRDLQTHFSPINELLRSSRDSLEDGVVENMIAGYGFVDSLLAQGINLLAMGNLKFFLELNALVLFGRDAGARGGAALQIAATERRFYEQEGGGIREVVEWHNLHRAHSPWRCAAGVYISLLSEPQLFIEGNHRTGALVMSYILAREGFPPFVMTTENARAFLDPSTLVTETRKRSLAALFRLPKIMRYFAEFLKKEVDWRYLLAPPAGHVASRPFR
jgi:hypothetical protein